MANNPAIITGLIRFSFIALFKPKAIAEGAALKYQACLLIDKKNKAEVKKTKAAIEEAINNNLEFLGIKKINGELKFPKNFTNPLRDGDEDKDDEIFEGHYFLNAYGNRKPGIVDKNRDVIDDPDEVYSGMWGRADINFYPYNKAGNVGIACGLNNVQKVKDGERLDGSKSAKKAFDDGMEFDEDEDANDLV